MIDPSARGVVETGQHTIVRRFLGEIAETGAGFT